MARRRAMQLQDCRVCRVQRRAQRHRVGDVPSRARAPGHLRQLGPHRPLRRPHRVPHRPQRGADRGPVRDVPHRLGGLPRVRCDLQPQCLSPGCYPGGRLDWQPRSASVCIVATPQAIRPGSCGHCLHWSCVLAQVFDVPRPTAPPRRPIMSLTACTPSRYWQRAPVVWLLVRGDLWRARAAPVAATATLLASAGRSCSWPGPLLVRRWQSKLNRRGEGSCFILT